LCVKEGDMFDILHNHPVSVKMREIDQGGFTEEGPLG